MSYRSNKPGTSLTAGQQTALNSFVALTQTPAGQHLAKDAGGNFVNTPDSGGGGTPGGLTTQLQYNNAGAFGGISGATTNGTLVTFLSTGIELADATTNTKKVNFNLASITAATTRTLTVQDASGTIALLSNHLGQFGATTSAQLASVISDETGTGALVFANTPTLVTPVLGAATGTSLVLSSKLDEAKGADIASAATTNIGAATGNYVNVTGTTTITALGTIQAGARRIVQFSSALTLTHNATSLILPTSANITTAAGDTAEFVSLGAGNWKCTWYMRATGQPLAGGGGTDISCRVTRTANFSSVTGTNAAIPWDSETYDTNNMHDNVTNNTRITFNTAGKYQINVVLLIATGFGNGLFSNIRINGSTNIVPPLTLGWASPSMGYLSYSETYSFSAGDYIEIMAQTNTSTVDLHLNSYVTAYKVA